MDSQPIGTVDAFFLDVESPTTLNNMTSLSIHDPSTAQAVLFATATFCISWRAGCIWRRNGGRSSSTIR